MQFQIQKEKLAKLLQTISGVVERKAQGAGEKEFILAHVLIKLADETLSLSALDAEKQLIGKIPLPLGAEDLEGATCVPFKKLHDIIKTLPEGDILFNQSNNRLTLKSAAGKSRFSLTTLGAEKFPAMETIEGAHKLTVACGQLKNLLEKTAFSMAEQDVRYYLNGLLIETKENMLYAVGADGHRLAISKTELDAPGTKNIRIVVPRKSILELLRLLGAHPPETEVTLNISDNHLKIEIGDIVLTTRLLEGRFPDYNSVFPKETEKNKTMTGEKQLLKEAFQRASVLFTDKLKGVRLKLLDNKLLLSASNSDKDMLEEEVMVEYEALEIEIAFNARYLLDFLNAIETEKITFVLNDPASSAVMSGEGIEDTRYVIMPMRL